jgi:hypothetical protein
MIRALAILGLLVAGKAQALTPVPECFDAAVGEYDVEWQGGGFIFYQAFSDGPYHLLLDDCRNDRRLSMILEAKGTEGEIWMAEEALYKRVFAALRSEKSYTMRQIAAIAKESGARTKLGKATYQSCGCQLAEGEQAE